MLRLPQQSAENWGCFQNVAEVSCLWNTDPNVRYDASRPKLITSKRVILLGAREILFGLHLHVV